MEYYEDIQKNVNIINKNLYYESKDGSDIISEEISQTESDKKMLENKNIKDDYYLDSNFFE